MTNSAFSMPFQAFDSDAFTKFFTMPDSMGSFARETMEASTKSTRASVKGLQDAGTTVMRQMKDHVTLSVETGKKLADVESIEDAMTVQADYVKTAIAANMKGFNELSTLYADTVREAFSPLAKQVKKTKKAA